MRRCLPIAALVFFALANASSPSTLRRATETITITINTTTTSSSTPSAQALAASVLETVQDRLTTAFSTRERVIETGFPLLWEPCVTRRILENKKTSYISTSTSPNTTTTSFHVLVLGGSSAARPGNNCSSPMDPFGGRYSNLLQEHLQNDWDGTIDWHVTNMAQGAEVSAQGALFFDSTIDKDRTDVIVWDYSINDSSNQGGTQEEVRKLDFWLTRLRQYYDDTPPPPIVLTYLWPHRAGIRLSRGLIDTLDKQPLTYLGDLLDAYRGLGWDIALVNLGAAVDVPALQRNFRLLFDDSAHPGCGGTQLLADMLQYTLLHNLAQDCPSNLLGQRGELLPSLPTPPETPWPDLTTTLPDLWVDLFDSRAVIGSFSAWVPRVENGHSNLNWTIHDYIHPNDNTSSWPLETLDMHTQASREDKKYGYRLTRCSENQPLTITLHEAPDLKWLGLALRGSGGIRLEINRQPIHNLRDHQVQKWDYGQQFLTHWIPILENIQQSPNTNATNANTTATTTFYELSFCHANTYTQQQILREPPTQELPNLQYLIGVSLPSPSSAF